MTVQLFVLHIIRYSWLTFDNEDGLQLRVPTNFIDPKTFANKDIFKVTPDSFIAAGELMIQALVILRALHMWPFSVFYDVCFFL